ncbi:conserved hypothetical protein [Thiomonas sp. X19]|uniref:uroporphyrinogen-III synthase n=1 Tax=Thiomonas sp. X19 TaxID=1050370 RepID=UPI000B726851|nr:uroporphyrinogen-III synthase [Thiomonas sp. X19]SCC94575.1 conserved hypothetical protein [Thiomonas sp. X19]
MPANPPTSLILTRPQAEAGDDARSLALRQAGVVLHHFPLIRILPPRDAAAAAQALAALADFDLAVPVSPAAVHAALGMLRTPWPEACAVGLVGPGSRAAFEQALRARGESSDTLRIISAPAEAADSEGLWLALQGLCARLPQQRWADARVLLLRGGAGRDWLADTLTAAGARVCRVSVYRREAPAPDAATLTRLRSLLADSGGSAGRATWLLTASEGVRNLQNLLAPAGLQASVLGQHRALATHARIAASAREIGFGRVDLCTPDTASILQALRVS